MSFNADAAEVRTAVRARPQCDRRARYPTLPGTSLGQFIVGGGGAVQCGRHLPDQGRTISIGAPIEAEKTSGKT
jgi:hypothetical protein